MTVAELKAKGLYEPLVAYLTVKRDQAREMREKLSLASLKSMMR